MWPPDAAVQVYYYTLEGNLPPGAPQELPLAGEEVEGEFRRGFVCFGCPVGEDMFVIHKLQEVAKRIADEARQTVEVLVGDKQALWCALRSSINNRFGYWCQLVRPSLCRPVAEELDQQLWQVLEAAIGFQVPRALHGLDGNTDCRLDVPVEGLQGRPFAEWVVRQPIQLHGAGLSSHQDSCYPAYLGALQQAAPYMARQPGMEVVLGGQMSWGEEADPGTRWSALLDSGQLDGEELRSAWVALQLEARESADYLGEEVEGVLAVDVAGAGSSRERTGEEGIKQLLTETRAKVRGLVLLRALQLHPERAARPVMSWRERDKLSSAWLLCLPGPDSALSSAEFGEGFANFLCLPSPACQPRLGEEVPGRGRGRVCRYGDTVANATMKGDGPRRRHDAMKLVIRGLLTWAGIPTVCEVFNLFADCIPQDGLARIERGRRRQGLVPDFKLRGKGGEGELLCELKTMSACKSRYPLNPQPGVRAVDRRAEGLTADYARKARNTDREYGGTPRPPPPQQGIQQPPRVVGRVEARLLSYGRVRGWVFGAWSEASNEVHSMVQRVAEARMEVADLQPGVRGAPRSKTVQLAQLVGHVRRKLSINAVQQTSRLLLDRLQLLGDGATEAAGRRDRAVVVEAVAARERRAQEVCVRQGRGIVRRGFGLLD